MNLEQVATLLGASITELHGSEIRRLKELQRKHESWGWIAGLTALGATLVLFVTLVFTQIIMRGGFLTLLGSLLILLAIAAGIMGYFQASAKALKQKLAEPRLAAPAEQPHAIAQSVARPAVTPASVTEGTTELLIEENDRSTREAAS